MKNAKRRLTAVALAAVLGLTGCSGATASSAPAAASAPASQAASAPADAAGEKLSAPGQYAGYSEAVYDELDYERHSTYVEMTDGTKIAVDYCLPVKDGVAATEPLPVIFELTPYNRAKYAEEGDYLKDGVLPNSKVLPLLQYGYVVAMADARGTGASTGCRITTNSRLEAADGAAVIEWLAAQSFCDGNVGTVGSSYTGQTQLEMISMKPEHLVASTIGCTDYNKYDGWFRGGVPRAFGSNPDTNWGETPEEQEATVQAAVEATVPVDEDADKALLYDAVKEHMGSLSQIELFKSMLWRNSFCEETGTELWNDVSASAYKQDINDSGVAIYLFGGDYDVFRRDIMTMYPNLTTPKKLTFCTWYHTEPKQDVDWLVEQHRWFDYWMKGIDNGVTTEDPMTIKIGNYNFETDTYQGEGTGELMTTTEWPIDAGTRQTVYLATGDNLSGDANDEGILTDAAPEATAVDYQVKYGIKSSVESKITTTDEGDGMDQLGVTFTGAPLAADQQVIGHPMANIAVSLEDAGWMTEDYDLDVFVSLSDYDPATGKAFLVTEGHLRTSLRAESDNCPYDFLGLPWHEDLVGSNEYLNLGETYALNIDMQPTAYTFKAGHCLRVTLTDSMDRMNYYGRPQYEADPNVATPAVKYHLGGDNGCAVTLPNIYAK